MGTWWFNETEGGSEEAAIARPSARIRMLFVCLDGEQPVQYWSPVVTPAQIYNKNIANGGNLCNLSWFSVTELNSKKVTRVMIEVVRLKTQYHLQLPNSVLSLYQTLSLLFKI